MAAHFYEYHWKAWRVESIIPRSTPLPNDIFFIQIRSRDFLKSQNLYSKSVDDRYVQEPLNPMKVKSVFVKKESLLRKEEGAEKFIYDVLRSTGVPCHLLRVVTDDMVAFARSMMDFTPRRDVLPMVFAFSTVNVETTDENDVPNPPRAAKSGMPGAKRRRVADSRTRVE